MRYQVIKIFITAAIVGIIFIPAFYIVNPGLRGNSSIEGKWHPISRAYDTGNNCQENGVYMEIRDGDFIFNLGERRQRVYKNSVVDVTGEDFRLFLPKNREIYFLMKVDDSKTVKYAGSFNINGKAYKLKDEEKNVIPGLLDMKRCP